MRVAALSIAMGFMFLWSLPLWGEVPATRPRTILVALDGTGDFISIQEAVDAATKGDTVFVKPGAYAQDLTIHSKESIKLVGAGIDRVTLLGREDVVGVL